MKTSPLMIIGLLLLAGGGVYIYMKKKKAKADEPTPPVKKKKGVIEFPTSYQSISEKDYATAKTNSDRQKIAEALSSLRINVPKTYVADTRQKIGSALGGLGIYTPPDKLTTNV